MAGLLRSGLGDLVAELGDVTNPVVRPVPDPAEPSSSTGNSTRPERTRAPASTTKAAETTLATLSTSTRPAVTETSRPGTSAAPTSPPPPPPPPPPSSEPAPSTASSPPTSSASTAVTSVDATSLPPISATPLPTMDAEVPFTPPQSQSSISSSSSSSSSSTAPATTPTGPPGRDPAAAEQQGTVLDPSKNPTMMALVITVPVAAIVLIGVTVVLWKGGCLRCGRGRRQKNIIKGEMEHEAWQKVHAEKFGPSSNY